MPNSDESSDLNRVRKPSEKSSSSGVSSSSGQPANPPPTNPMEGGHWRPVRPEELLRKNAPTERESHQLDDNPKLIRQRRQELEVHLKSSPTDQEAFRELASIYRQEDRPQEAKRVLTEALRIFPDNASLLWDLEEAKLARSLQQYREVSDLAARLKTSEVERELKRSREDWAYRRIEVCEARLKRDPSLEHLRLVLAEAYIDTEQQDKAISELDALVKNDEFSPQAYLLRGKCLLSLGHDVQAMASLRAAGLRRAVVAPLQTRLAALRLLCETAQRLGIELLSEHYQRHLAMVEAEIAKSTTAAKMKRV
ncbi:Tetratricopeptide repeat protein [Novipirellula galeiformis]|uniref:Tetratricopeptide repeat protein n=1 Tax=Novipirellula galeiformis TaxID=2528004 RepID=A0A5C6CD28_9BACT|nr:tetratricopeptide repeat protein [Novipirellula galeiformis]TWU21627.1 Tetratricopeptide repeat protein [Novipirellula galeiformis]